MCTRVYTPDNLQTLESLRNGGIPVGSSRIGVPWASGPATSGLSSRSASKEPFRFQSNHGLSESCITDEQVVNTQEFSLLAFLLERIRDEVLVIPWLLPVTVPVGSSFLDVAIRNREEIESVLDEFLVLLRSISQEVPARATDDADVPVRQTCFALYFGFHID